MLINRIMGEQLKRLDLQYPIVTITGPRQSGKTTLCKMVFPERAYVSLENPDHRRLAESDPRGFFATYLESTIIDEIQRVPALFSYIQEIVDNRQSPGQFILTGSSQFELMESITQSLAGRTALLKLLPFSYDEAYPNSAPAINHMMFRGFFPRIHDKELNPYEAYAFYLETYIERDVRSLLNIKDHSTFELFIRLSAGRTGQILNMTSLSTEVGVSVHTIKSWLSVLETSFIVYIMQPHHANFRKRLVKSPKLYFMDTGLVCYLLGITNPVQLATHPLRGAIFETFVVTELLKQSFNRVRRPNIYFFRDNTGHEIDVLIDRGLTVQPVEIKSGATIRTDFFRGLEFYKALNPNAERGVLVYAGEGNQKLKFTDVLDFRSLTNLEVGR